MLVNDTPMLFLRGDSLLAFRDRFLPGTYWLAFGAPRLPRRISGGYAQKIACPNSSRFVPLDPGK